MTQSRNRSISSSTSISLHALSILLDMPSGPGALSDLSRLRAVDTSDLVMIIGQCGDVG